MFYTMRASDHVEAVHADLETHPNALPRSFLEVCVRAASLQSVQGKNDGQNANTAPTVSELGHNATQKDTKCMDEVHELICDVRREAWRAPCGQLIHVHPSRSVKVRQPALIARGLELKGRSYRGFKR